MPSLLVVLLVAFARVRRSRFGPQNFEGRDDKLFLGMSSRQIESKEIPCRKFFAAFNNHVNERVERADQMQGVSSKLSDTLVINTTTALMLSDGSQEATDFVREFILHGGFAILKLPVRDEDPNVLSKMWGLTKTLFERIDRHEWEDSHENLGLRSQSLIRAANDKESGNTVGYSYVEANNRKESSDALEKIVGNAFASSIASDSLNLLTIVGTKLAAVIAAQLISMHPTKAYTMMKYLIGESHEEKNISFQRFARYKPASQEKTETENLGSHCDWSVFTIVPVSEVPGLQVFDTYAQTWISPEDVARKYAVEDSASGCLSDDWNGAYIVVMTGKWLELLVNGGVESTIHRVISVRNTPRRYSAPFFLRLGLEILDTLEDLALEEPDDVLVSRSAISTVLQQFPFYTKG